jgi:hypothetical protein
MDVTSTIKALRERCPSFQQRVFGTAQMAQVDLENINPEMHPSAYVMCIREDTDDLSVTENSYRQEVTARVAVVILTPNEDERGQLASARAEQLKEEVFKALLGWSPNHDRNSYYVYEQMWVLVNNRAYLGIQLEFTLVYAISSVDTRIPDQLEKDCGRFDTLDMSIDKIETPPGAPDGQEDVHMRLINLYGDSDDESESESS